MPIDIRHMAPFGDAEGQHAVNADGRQQPRNAAKRFSNSVWNRRCATLLLTRFVVSRILANCSPRGECRLTVHSGYFINPDRTSWFPGDPGCRTKIRYRLTATWDVL